VGVRGGGIRLGLIEERRGRLRGRVREIVEKIKRERR
jgi:hypothetical protein